MFQSLKSGFSVVLLSSCFGFSLSAAEFYPISSISSSTSASDLYEVNNLIQGIGEGFNSSEPHASIGGGATHTWVTDAPNGSGTSYFDDGIADPVLIIDLGADRLLSEISTWGYANSNTNGGKGFTLRFAKSEEGSDSFGSSITYSPTFEAAFSADDRDSHPFSQAVSTRYIELTFSDNWRGLQGGTSGGDRVGLGEVAFEDLGSPAGPFLEIQTSFNLSFDDSVQTIEVAMANLGASRDLALSGLSLSGSHAANFSVISSPNSLVPLSNGILELRFDPKDSGGFFSAQLELSSNDVLNPATVVSFNVFVGQGVSNSGVRINEFVASNSSSLDDGDGNSSDWIELFNAGPGTVDLSGWFLTDSATNLNKWEFPAGTSLDPNDYLIVFASGQKTDDYVDPSGFLHTNFKLSTGGEYLALVMPDGTTVKSEFDPSFPDQFSDVSYGTFSKPGISRNLTEASNAEVLIPKNGDLGLTWAAPSFVTDDSWLKPETGSGVGFDRGTDYVPYINVDILDELRNQGSSAYIRLPFTIENAASLAELKFTIRYDDGFIAYLNGAEIVSRNSPANPDWESVATQNVDEDDNLETVDVSAFLSSLHSGLNVIAIHALNRSASSSDFLADASLTATSVSTGPLSLGYLSRTTPGALNTGGSANPGPEIEAVTHTPEQPSEAEGIIVSATVMPRLVAVDDVILSYRIEYGGSTELLMTDDGIGGDAIAGDSIYTATIPASAYGREEMVRWFVTAKDASSSSSRAPAFLDQSGNNQSPEYFGTVTRDPSVMSEMPILQWFTQNESASHRRSGTRASVYFLGRFYDNIFVRQRGGFTNASVSQKFDFNKGDPFFVSEEMSSVGEINLNGNGSDSTYIRQPMSFDTHRLAGNEGCISELWQLRVNGGNDRVGVAIEQVDEDFLERYNYDPDGDLYKFVQRNNLNPVFFDTITGIEKKTGDESDLGSVEELVSGLNLPTSGQRRRWVVDHLDLPQIINYLAARSIIQDADDLRKNFYMYLDVQGDCRWRIFPWDKDFTFGVRGDGGTHLPHPFFGDEEHKKQNANQWNVLYDVIFEEQVTQRIYLRRLRTLMDELLQPSSILVDDRIMEQLARSILDPASPPLSSNINSIDSYLRNRRNVLFNDYPSLIPATQTSNPDLVITEVEANPSSGNQEEEFIRIHNNENTEIDVSGWTLEGGVNFTFRAGTVIERNGDLYVTPSNKDFLGRATSPTGGEEHLTAAPYSGHLSNFGEVLTLKDSDGMEIDSLTTPNEASDAQLFLVVSEVMYHPADPNSDAEFVELMNISDSVTLDLTNVKFTAGIDFTFSAGTMLSPGARILVVLDQAAFEAVHGNGHPVSGTFQNDSRLSNGGDRIKLEDADNSTIQEFTYGDESPWPTGADGDGFSLVLVGPSNSPEHGKATSWRESTLVGGNPGTSDATKFTGDSGTDVDGDGQSALLEYAFGTSPVVANQSPFEVKVVNGIVRISTTINQAADDLSYSIQHSANLAGWLVITSDVSLISRTNLGNGRSQLVFEGSSDFLGSQPRHFFRMKASVSPWPL